FGIAYPKLPVMWALLVGLYRGLLPLAPELLLAPVGLVMFWRTPKTRRHLLVVAGIPLYYYLLNSSYVNWWGGWCYGPRYLSAGLFFLSPALALAWTAGG